MRVIGHIPHDVFKITVFAWNGKYLIKIETAMLEQTYKVNEWDISREEDIYKLPDEAFMQRVTERFVQMQKDLHEAMERF
jgi:hypothetical protein